MPLDLQLPDRTYQFKTEFLFDDSVFKSEIARQVGAEMLKSLRTSRLIDLTGA